MTAMTSASRTVLSRWAILITVLPFDSRWSASWTRPSDSESSADVASSRRRTVGFLSTARAIAIRCFCPPDSWAPRSPTRVL
mmetsp:Transcript_33757/g.79910  ORF Transcript_33757/g.79910 Transcript_33757/m.79910 type:complete len:82 (-) Transcript_33757:1953-2198(-)